MEINAHKYIIYFLLEATRDTMRDTREEKRERGTRFFLLVENNRGKGEFYCCDYFLHDRSDVIFSYFNINRNKFY